MTIQVLAILKKKYYYWNRFTDMEDYIDYV